MSSLAARAASSSVPISSRFKQLLLVPSNVEECLMAALYSGEFHWLIKDCCESTLFPPCGFSSVDSLSMFAECFEA